MGLGNAANIEKRAESAGWAEEFNLIPTFYGRLVYFAGLIDPDTGRYEHYTSTGISTGAQLSREIRNSHEVVFAKWMICDLEAKMSDVELYIRGLANVNRVDLIDAWLRLTPYKNLVPAAIQGPERQRHISDFEAILGLLKNVYGVAGPDRGA